MGMSLAHDLAPRINPARAGSEHESRAHAFMKTGESPASCAEIPHPGY